MMIRRLLLTIGLLLASGAAHATCPVIPFVFPANSINPLQVNANFTSVRDCIVNASSFVQVSNSAALRALSAGVEPMVYRQYNLNPGDGAAVYYWSPASTCADNGATCIKPASNPASGRWLVSTNVANGLQLNPGGGTSLVFTPAAQINREQFAATTSGAAGSSPTDQNNAALVWYRNTGNMTGGGVNTGVALAEFDYNDSGTVVNNDTFEGVAGNCNLLGARPNAGGGVAAACIGGAFGSRGFEYQGGNIGASQAQGEIHGLNIVAGVTMGSTTPSDYNDHVGAEVNMVGCVGCTVNARMGFYSVDFGDGSFGPTAQGDKVDAAIGIGSVAGATGWLYGIDFVGPPVGTGNALSNTGTLLGSSATSPTVATQGIDLSNFTISGFAFRGPGGTWTVSAAGDEIANSVEGKALIANNTLAMNSTVDFRAAGSSLWQVYREGTTNRFVVFDKTNNTPMVTGTTAGLLTLGEGANAVQIDAAGGVTAPALSTVAVVAGSVCQSALGVLIYKVGANCF